MQSAQINSIKQMDQGNRYGFLSLFFNPLTGVGKVIEHDDSLAKALSLEGYHFIGFEHYRNTELRSYLRKHRVLTEDLRKVRQMYEWVAAIDERNIELGKGISDVVLFPEKCGEIRDFERRKHLEIIRKLRRC